MRKTTMKRFPWWPTCGLLKPLLLSRPSLCAQLGAAAILLWADLAAGFTPMVDVSLDRDGAKGSLGPGERAQLILSVDTPPRPHEDDIVAILESPFLATRLLPLTFDQGTRTLIGHVDVEAPVLGAGGTLPKAIPVRVIVASRQGTRLTPLARRLLYVTMQPPQPDLRGNPVAGSLPAAPSEPPVPSGEVQPAVAPLPFAESDGTLQEQSLLPESASVPNPGYWSTVKARIVQSVREHLPAHHRTGSAQAVTVHFRLYANGDAQLIQIEQSSGDAAVDDAAMRAVVEAQPFPPFPPDITDPHLEVHIAVPPASSRARRQTDRPGGSVSISPATASGPDRTQISD
ncbi:putative Energy transducer TonB [Nitrospira tepida]|uniref:Energy transducer TonB n=2 Tax=Nitrospira tepida TaxID=2973512 RepID=A0AA86N1Y6_9BACT|nr:putative Energy transducer TonB [Nitrospira tepida]